MFRIEIEGKPIAWARAGCSRGRFFDRQSKEKTSFQWKLKTGFQKDPLIRPINLACVFSFEIPKSWPRDKRESLLGKPHESRPDLDNLVKWVGDAAQGVLWDDDAKIVKLNAEKVWAERDITIITFE
jgi:Holliday junction resolvase RusA-like endonuclease